MASSWFSLYSTIKMMHGPINIRFTYLHSCITEMISVLTSSHSNTKHTKYNFDTNPSPDTGLHHPSLLTIYPLIDYDETSHWISSCYLPILTTDHFCTPVRRYGCICLRGKEPVRKKYSPWLSYLNHSGKYRVSQEECARLREGVPYVKVYRYRPPLISVLVILSDEPKLKQVCYF